MGGRGSGERPSLSRSAGVGLSLSFFSTRKRFFGTKQSSTEPCAPVNCEQLELRVVKGEVASTNLETSKPPDENPF